jgi:hypothetical protein
MYWRLTGTFPHPEYVVLAEVSFGALLIAKGGASRYSFSQKRADFVLLDKAFRVLAAIELDDSSHKGKEQRDEARDAMLIAAGYRVLRYKTIPDSDRLRADVIEADTRPVKQLKSAELRPEPQQLRLPSTNTHPSSQTPQACRALGLNRQATAS